MMAEVETGFCSKCSEFIIAPGVHECAEYSGKIADEAATSTIWATSPEGAAEKFAEAHDEEVGEPCFLDNGMVVVVRNGKLSWRFRVRAELELKYSAGAH